MSHTSLTVNAALSELNALQSRAWSLAAALELADRQLDAETLAHRTISLVSEDLNQFASNLMRVQAKIEAAVGAWDTDDAAARARLDDAAA